MTTNQLNSDLGQSNSPLIAPKPSKLSVLGIIFFIMGAPNLYAFMQRRTENTTYSGSGFPRYALVVLVAIAIASLIEWSFI
jgi:hypothetical protein